MNCPNCGAPITGDKCEYCGTEFSQSRINDLTLKVDYSSILAAVRSNCITPNECRRLIGYDQI